MASKNYICQKGWILAPSPTDGKPVPFFVQVRSKDIHWDESSLPDNLVRVAREGKNFKTGNPSAKVTFVKDEWNIDAESDYTFTATKRLNIVNDGFTINTDDDTDLYLDFVFPFAIVNDGHFSINCTLNSICEDIATATINVDLDGADGDYITSARLHLRNLIYHFDSNYAYNDHYIQSYIYVTIKGTMSIM